MLCKDMKTFFEHTERKRSSLRSEHMAILVQLGKQVPLLQMDRVDVSLLRASRLGSLMREHDLVHAAAQLTEHEIDGYALVHVLKRETFMATLRATASRWNAS